MKGFVSALLISILGLSMAAGAAKVGQSAMQHVVAKLFAPLEVCK